MYCFINILNKRLVTNLGLDYLKASNSYCNYLLTNIISKKFSSLNYCKNNANHEMLEKISYCHLLMKRNVCKSNCETIVTKNTDTNELSNIHKSESLKKSLEVKYKVYKDDDNEVILDVNEQLVSNELGKESDEQIVEELEEELYLYQEKKKPKIGMNEMDLKRGITGVFDIQELVQLLRDENMKEIAVIEVPPEMKYCDFLVLANATSLRHLNAFVEYMNKVYKMKKHKKDPFLSLGGNDSKDWKVIDMKNIVLHLFMKKTRDYYDIETLWTVGEQYDDKTQRPEVDSVVDIMEKHMKFLQDIKPSI